MTGELSVLIKAVRGPLRRWWLRAGIWWLLIWLIMCVVRADVDSGQRWLLSQVPHRTIGFRTVEWLQAASLHADIILLLLAFTMASIAYRRIVELAGEGGITAMDLSSGNLFAVCSAPGLYLLPVLLSAKVANIYWDCNVYWRLYAGEYYGGNAIYPADHPLHYLSIDLGHSLAIAFCFILMVALLTTTARRRYGYLLAIGTLSLLMLFSVMMLIRIPLYSGRVPLLSQSTTTGAELVGLLLITLAIWFAATRKIVLFQVSYWVVFLSLMLQYLPSIRPAGLTASWDNWISYIMRFIASSSRALTDPPLTAGVASLDTSAYELKGWLIPWEPVIGPGWLAYLVAFWLNLAWIAAWWLLIRYGIFGRHENRHINNRIIT